MNEIIHADDTDEYENYSAEIHNFQNNDLKSLTLCIALLYPDTNRSNAA